MSLSQPVLPLASVALAPAAVLRMLARAAGQSGLGEDDLPVVRVGLSNGQVVAGRLVLVGTDDGHEVVVLAHDALHNLSQVLRELRAAAQEVAVDELGRQAWAQIRAVRVEHRLREPLSMRKDADVLLVVADLTAALPRGMGVELRGQLNILL